MRLPVIHGLIRRRLLVNFRVDAEVMRRFLPAAFRPKLHRGHAIAGICLIRLEQIRPGWLPRFCGISSENAAHRIAVLWDEPSGESREGVFIPRRDTGSWLNHFAGGRIFPGEHQLADFAVTDNASRISMNIRARDGRMSVQLRAHNCAWAWSFGAARSHRRVSVIGANSARVAADRRRQPKRQSFQRGRVIAANHGVDVEIERHRSVTEFLDAVLWFQAPSHTNFQHILTEGTDIRDDINVAAASLLGH